MKGRGLLIGAAVIQLVGAAFFLLAGCIYAFLTPSFVHAMGQSNANADKAAVALQVFGWIFIVMSGAMIFTSIRLIQCRKWAWVVSLVMSCLFGALMLLGIVGIIVGASAVHMPAAVGMGEGFVIFIMATPVYVTIGLLIGGRQAATSGAAAPSA